ncbi:MAG: cobalamin B12-binding domain-containing protein [Saccharofermentanales bacterium]
MEDLHLLANEFEKALLQVNRVRAAEIFEQSFKERSSFDVLEELVTHTLEKIGTDWENGAVSLAQIYMSGIICEELIDQYLPKMDVKRKVIPKMAVVVLQDHHGLGKRILTSVLRAGGFEVLDFGHGVSVDDLVQKTIDNELEILLISTLMLPSALKVKDVKAKLIAKGSHTKIIVGGAPFRMDTGLWKSVDADADGKNASSIIKTVENVMAMEGIMMAMDGDMMAMEAGKKG